MSYLEQLFDAINDMANDFDDAPPNSVKAVVALSVLCQIEIDEKPVSISNAPTLGEAMKAAAEDLKPVMKVKANVAKKRGRKRKYCLYSGELLTGKQTKFASDKYAQAYWRENNREKIRAAYRKWYKKKKDA